MIIEKIRAMCHAQPFQEFVIHLEDGRTVPVQRREFILVTPRGSRIVVIQPDDSMSIIDLPQVAEVSQPGRHGY